MRGADHIDITGILLKGRYCIVEKIGQGGEGSMYVARDLELGIFRAVKELPIKCRREAGLLRLLDHSALPKMVDYAEQGEFCYIVMEYIRGKNLAQLMQDGKGLSIEDILRIGNVLLSVLGYLHSRKPAVYYGDLKPDNIIMTDTGNVYLVDFGSAIISYSAGRATNKGTIGYAAPEQYLGMVSAGSDWYSFGRTIETLCGKQKWKYYIQCPLLAFVIFKSIRFHSENRWDSDAQLSDIFKKIKPLHLRLRTILISISTILLTIIFMLGTIPQKHQQPELAEMIDVAIADYYSLSYRAGGEAQRSAIQNRIEEKLQRLLRVYTSAEDQIRIYELLADNGELADRADKAELYYRQLLTYEPEYKAGYAKYGLFLCRQARYQESRAVYKQWINYKKTNDTSACEADSIMWNLWTRKAGVILGRSSESFK